MSSSECGATGGVLLVSRQMYILLVALSIITTGLMVLNMLLPVDDARLRMNTSLCTAVTWKSARYSQKLNENSWPTFMTGSLLAAIGSYTFPLSLVGTLTSVVALRSDRFSFHTM